VIEGFDRFDPDRPTVWSIERLINALGALSTDLGCWLYRRR
jgi:hypothetical protein